ncbi:MAG TPA: ribonuclease III [Thermodesulfobacteriota bacterium]|nr:ribonuclease III [Thermodesulfobacteriota bacterium]
MTKYDTLLQEFNRAFEYPIKDPELLVKVFTHRSFLNEPGGGRLESNERLEFLGDAILAAVISHMLYVEFPEVDEGKLTRLRARLVNKRTLAELAKEVGLDRYLLLGKGEASTGGRDNPTILAGVFEALMAALYLDSGFKDSFTYIEDLFGPLLEGAHREPGHFDYKPQLQELSQKLFKSPPRYRLVKESGPPHKKTFEIEVSVNGEALGTGTARKKKDAEQAAAAEALGRLRRSTGQREKP